MIDAVVVVSWLANTVISTKWYVYADSELSQRVFRASPWETSLEDSR